MEYDDLIDLNRKTLMRVLDYFDSFVNDLRLKMEINYLCRDIKSVLYQINLIKQYLKDEEDLEKNKSRISAYIYVINHRLDHIEETINRISEN